MTKRPSWRLCALALMAFLIPVIGGQIPTEPQPLAEGFGPLVQALTGGGELPQLTYALLALIPVLVLAITLWRKRVIQVPHIRVTALIAIFLGLLGASIAVSSFRFNSAQAWVTWLGYGAAFLAVPCVAGRRSGPVLLCAALSGGCGLAGAKAIAEYAQMRATDPSWRVFGDWVNPNALASILTIGLLLSLALMLVWERQQALAAFAIAVLSGFGLVLTQSKGGFLAALIGIALLFILTTTWGGLRTASKALAPLGVVIVLALGLRFAPQAKEQGALTRLGQASATSEQSGEFRTLLWKSSIALMREEPVGRGVGTFGYHSAEPGLTAQTVLAHNSFLQLGVEGGVLAPALLLGAGIAWLIEMFRGARKLPAATNLMRSGVIAAVVASGAHSMIDSDLYYPGLGLAFFLLLALGLQMATDGVSPELTPSSVRRTLSIVGCGSIALALTYFAFGEWSKARMHGLLASGATDEVRQRSDGARALFPSDPEVWRISAIVSPQDAVRYWQRACDLGPRTRSLRSLARALATAGQPSQAVSALRKALRFDPLNLRTNRQLVETLRDSGFRAEALEVARKMVESEQTPYFKIRALPQLVPTETYWARTVLAEALTDTEGKITLLRPALYGYAKFMQTTAPEVLRGVAQLGPGFQFGDVSLQDVQEVRDAGARLVTELERLYRELGDLNASAEVMELAVVFRSE